MKFKKWNLIQAFTLLITFQASFIEAIDAKEFTPSTLTFLDNDNDSNLFTNNALSNEDNSEIILRRIRQVNLNNTINQDIDKLNIRIANLTETMKKESGKFPSNANGTFSHPNSTAKFKNLGIEIKKMKDDIEKLKNAPNIAESFKVKLRGVEASVESLQKVFDDKNREFGTQMGNLESFVDGLINTVGDVRRELDRINHLLDEKENLENQRLLPAEIIQDIKGRDFDNAIKNIQKLDNLKKRINYIVHEVYNNNAGNFDLILQLGNSSSSVQIALLIYEALHYEMESNSHNNALKLFKLIENLDSDLFQSLTPGDTLNEVDTLKEKLSNLISVIAAEMLKGAVKTNDYKAVSELLDKIYATRLFWYTTIIKQVVGIVIDNIDAETLVRFFKSCNYYGQKVFGYEYVFYELRSRSRLNQTAIVTLAMDLKYGKKEVDYQQHKYSDAIAIGSTIGEIKALLPHSVRRLVFTDCLNIKRVYRDEYLVTRKEQTRYYPKVHDVLISSIDIRSFGRYKWAVQPAGDMYYYIKSNYTEEYLYGRDDGYGPRQKLCTKIPDPSDSQKTWLPRDDRDKWIFEPSEHNVYIKNAQINKYLYVESWDDSPEKFVTWGIKANESLWSIVDCYSGV